MKDEYIGFLVGGCIIGFALMCGLLLAMDSFNIPIRNTVHYKTVYDNNWSYDKKRYKIWVLNYENEKAISSLNKGIKNEMEK